MGAYLPFFPVWLKMNGVNREQTGLVFSFISFFSLIFQPLVGIVSDKLGLKKKLVYTLSILLIFFGPFFIFVLGPLLQVNITLGAIVGGFYIGVVFNSGAPMLEAYVDKISRNNDFEFGRVRTFGFFGWAICASFVGMMISKNINMVFWLCSGFAFILLLLTKLVDATPIQLEQPIKKEEPFSFKLLAQLLKMPQIWYFMLYVAGVASIYDVFDQQFANFFTSFFKTQEEGQKVFGFVTTFGESLNAIIMFIAPWIVFKIGSKNALLLAGLIMTIRITGSSFATSYTEVILLKMLHMFESPILIVSVFKYIVRNFPVKLSATVFLIAFCVSKQISMMIMSVVAGYMYGSLGFKSTYFILGMIVLSFTTISCFTLSGRSIKAIFAKRSELYPYECDINLIQAKRDLIEPEK